MYCYCCGSEKKCAPRSMYMNTWSPAATAFGSLWKAVNHWVWALDFIGQFHFLSVLCFLSRDAMWPPASQYHCTPSQHDGLNPFLSFEPKQALPPLSHVLSDILSQFWEKWLALLCLTVTLEESRRRKDRALNTISPKFSVPKTI